MNFGIMWPAALGAILQEVLWWWNIRRAEDDEQYNKIMHSARYWLTVLVFVLITALVAIVWFDGKAPSMRDALVFGAFLPLIVKQAGKALLPGQNLGNEDTPEASKSFSIRSYLGR